MRVWLDILTPKQALFFAPLYLRLKEQGHQSLVSTRIYREAQQALRFKRLPHVTVGRHGGPTKLGKLESSAKRIATLAQRIEDWTPDVAVSFSSPEATRVAFGLGVTHVAVNDSPHSWMVARLSIPLSAFVCSPWIIKKAVWKAFGARGVVAYKALDPASWLKHHTPNPGILSSLGLDKDRPIVFLRTEEAFASYLMGRASDRASVVLPVIERLLRLGSDVQVVVSTRYGLQSPTVRRRFGDKVVLLERIVDATSLISFSSAFIGAGGTMTIEAALLGTPAVSCFPGEKPLYIKYLESKGLVSTIHSPERITREVDYILKHREAYEERRQKGQSLLKWMEDPTDKVMATIGKAKEA